MELFYIGKVDKKEPELEINNLFEEVKESLSRLCSKSIERNAPGFKFTNLSTTKNPQYYFDFINIEQYFRMVINKAITPTSNPSLKMVEHFKKLSHDNYKKFIYEPDERIEKKSDGF